MVNLYLRAASPTYYTRPYSLPYHQSYTWVAHGPQHSYPAGRLLGTAGGAIVHTSDAHNAGPVTAPGFVFGDYGIAYFSEPITTAVTISGDISFSISAYQAAASQNTTLRMLVYRLKPDGSSSLVIDWLYGNNLPIATDTAIINAGPFTPTSTDFAVGDRIAVWCYEEDATALTMTSGTTYLATDHPTTGYWGHSYISFTESLSITSWATPTGTTLDFTNKASMVSGKLLMTNVAWPKTSTLYTASTPAVNNKGTFAQEWVSPRLAAQDIIGPVSGALQMSEDNALANVTPGWELYKVNEDGSSPVLLFASRGESELGTTAVSYAMVGDYVNTSVTAGQRLKVVVTLSSAWSLNSASGYNGRLYAEGTTDSSIRLPVALAFLDADSIVAGTGAVTAAASVTGPARTWIANASAGSTPQRPLSSPTDQTSTWTAHAGLGANVFGLVTTGNSGTTAYTTTTVAGPLSGYGLVAKTGGLPYMWMTPPLNAVTIDSSVDFAWHAYESNALANATLRFVLYRVTPAGVVTEFANWVYGTELATGSAVSASSGNVTPTTTSIAQGDRIAMVVYVTDATSLTMASGYSVYTYPGNPTAPAADLAVNFQDTVESAGYADPTGAHVDLQLTASDLGGAGQMKMWDEASYTTGSSVTSTAAAPGNVQLTSTAGGQALSWFTPPLGPQTITGNILVGAYGLESSTSANATFYYELYSTDVNGDSPVLVSAGAGVTELGTTNTALSLRGVINTTLTEGQRLKLVLGNTSAPGYSMAASYTTTQIIGLNSYNKITFPVAQLIEAQADGTGSVMGAGFTTADATSFLISYGDASVIGGGIPAATGTQIIRSTSSAAGVGSTSAASLLINRSTSSAAGAGSVTATGRIWHPGTSTIAGVGVVTAAGGVRLPGVSSAAGVGATTALATTRSTSSAAGVGSASTALVRLGSPSTQVGAGATSALAGVQVIAPALAGVGVVTATKMVRVPGTSSAAGAGVVSGLGYVVLSTANDGSGATDVTGTWSVEANAYDNNATTYSTTSSSVTTHVLDITGYDFSSVLGPDDTLVSVTVNVSQYVDDAAKFNAPTIQAFNGTTALGSPITLTERSGAGNEDETLTADVTLADLRSANFKMRFSVQQTSL